MQRCLSFAWIIVVLASLLSCSRTPGSVTLSLRLRAGMVHTTRFSIQERIEGDRTAGHGRAAAAPGDLSTKMTYRFRVLSIDHEGVAKLRCRILAASASTESPDVSRYIQSLEKTPFVLYLDRAGRLVGEQGSPDIARLLGRGPIAPGSLSKSGPVAGDLGAIFGGLNGKSVSLGSTWSSPLPEAEGGGLSGKITWTVESIGRSTSRLAFEGSIHRMHVQLPGVSPAVDTELSGTVGGFVVVERQSSWPVQGKSVIDATLSLPGDTALGTPSRRLASVKIITLFDPVQ